MFGSHLPIEGAVLGFDKLYDAYECIVAGFSDQEKDAMFRGTAEGASEERKRLHLVSGAVRVGQVKAAPAAGQLSVGHDQKLASLLECCRSAAPITVLGDDG